MRAICLGIALSITVMISDSSAILTNGLVGYWPFDGNANDMSGYNNHGAIHGNLTYAQGSVNQAAIFDQPGIKYVEVAHQAQYVLTNAYTVSLWFKSSSSDGGYGKRILQKHWPTQNDNNRNMWEIYWGNGITSLIWCVAWQSSSFEQLWAPRPFEITAWNHVAFTYNLASNELKEYVNGSCVTNKSPSHIMAPLDTTLSLLFMHDRYGSSWDAVGMLDDVRIYNRVLSAPEILALCSTNSLDGFPATPEDVSASDGDYTDKVAVSWGVVSNASGYQVYRHTENSTNSAEKIASTASTSYDDTVVEEDTTYYYWIKATNGAGASAFSAHDTGYRAPSVSVLNPPSGVTASDGTYSNKVAVSWSTVAGALNYEVWRNTSNQSASAAFVAQTTNSLSYDDCGVSAGVTYYYWLKAKNDEAVSEFSSPDSGYVSYTPPTPAGSADLYLSDLVFLPNTLTNLQHPGAISVNLMNQGPNNMASPDTRIALDVYLSANAVFGDADDISMGDCASDQALAAGSYASLVVPSGERVKLTVPGAVTGGAYNVFARVRHAYPSGLTDPDESNNHAMRSSPVTIYVADTNNPVPPPDTGYHLINDYDGDGKSDLAVYRESNGKWDVMLSGSGYQAASIVFGGPGHEPVLADYDGDGKSDPAVYQENTGAWKVMLSKLGYAVQVIDFGGSGYAPVPADYDGDGLADPIVYRESSGEWIILPSAGGYVALLVNLGGNGYKAVPADYDGDGKSDLAVYRRSTGDWYFRLSTLDYFTMNLQFGGSGRLPVPADFDGDGKADPAVYKETSGEWSVMMTRFSYMTAQAVHGGNGYAAVPADYDGDGKGDVVVYGEQGGILKVLLSGSGYALTVVDGIGGPGYEPVGVVK